MSQPRGEGDRLAHGPANRPRSAPRQGNRKPYVKPTLQAYGSLVDVTAFGGSRALDSGMGNLQNP